MIFVQNLKLLAVVIEENKGKTGLFRKVWGYLSVHSTEEFREVLRV